MSFCQLATFIMRVEFLNPDGSYLEVIPGSRLKLSSVKNSVWLLRRTVSVSISEDTTVETLIGLSPKFKQVDLERDISEQDTAWGCVLILGSWSFMRLPTKYFSIDWRLSYDLVGYKFSGESLNISSWEDILEGSYRTDILKFWKFCACSVMTMGFCWERVLSKELSILLNALLWNGGI